MTSVSDIARHRAKPRLKLFQPTSMRVDGETVRAHLLDLSATGAMVHAAPPPRVGQFVLIDCGAAMRGARVAWVSGARFGIAFTAPLPDAVVDEAVAMNESAVAAAAARIGPLCR